MAEYVDFTLTFTDNSSGDRDEDGTEVQIYTDSPSYRPTVKINYAEARHAWMGLPLVNAGVTTLPIRLKTPVTFVTVRVRQFNANGYGEWNFPGGAAGMRFDFTSGSLVNRPDAPTNVGLVVTGTPTPPVDPPVDPPPPPPPTGGGGASSNYAFTSQFSGTQGLNGWAYRDASGNSLTYSAVSGVWSGVQDYQTLWNGGIHPGTTVGTVLRWTVPANGTVLVSGTTNLYASSGSNGVTFTMKHNAATIDGPVSMTTTAVHTMNETVVVVAGDTIDFIVEPISGNSNCSTSLMPVVQLTTDGTTPTNPIVSSLTPTSFTVGVGGTFPLTVALTSAAIESASVSLSSSDAAKITVPATVIVPIGAQSAQFSATGVAAGTSTITATYNSTNKTSAGTAQTSTISGNFTNIPAGGTLLLQDSFTSLPLRSGLLDIYNSAKLVDDGSAPVSPSKVIRYRMEPLALEGGGELQYFHGSLWRSLYMGVSWRTNPQFQGRPVGNKLWFVGGPEMGGVFLFNGSGLVNGQGQLLWSQNTLVVDNTHVSPAPIGGLMFYPNVSSGALSVGVWYKLECFIKSSTTMTSRDGIYRWWVNGVLAGNYTNVNWAPQGLNWFDFTQTWDACGGRAGCDLGQVNTNAWEHYLDHFIMVGVN